jgi:hypothetical protein
VRIGWTGDVNADEARLIRKFIDEHTGTLVRAHFVTDVARLGKMPPDAREALMTRPPRLTNEQLTYRLAFAGANVRTKMIMSLIIAGANLTQRDALDCRFFSSLDDAIAWVLDEATDGALSSVGDHHDLAR